MKYLNNESIAEVLGLDEKLIQNLFVKSGLESARESDEFYTRKEVYKLIEYFIDKSAITEARKLIDFEKSVEFQLIPKVPDPASLEQSLQDFINQYVPDPWGRAILSDLLSPMCFSPFDDEHFEFVNESWDVLSRIDNELSIRTHIE